MRHVVDIETTVRIDSLQESDLAEHVLSCFKKAGLTSVVELPLIERDIWYWLFHLEYEKGSTFRYYVVANPKLSPEKCDELKKLLCKKEPWGGHTGKVEALVIQPVELKC